MISFVIDHVPFEGFFLWEKSSRNRTDFFMYHFLSFFEVLVCKLKDFITLIWEKNSKNQIESRKCVKIDSWQINSILLLINTFLSLKEYYMTNRHINACPSISSLYCTKPKSPSSWQQTISIPNPFNCKSLHFPLACKTWAFWPFMKSGQLRLKAPKKQPPYLRLNWILSQS